MHTLVRSLAFLAGAVVLSAAHAPDNNPIDVVVTGGPYAGSYKSDPADSYCMHSTKHDILSPTWQSAKQGVGPKEFTGVGIDVSQFKGTAAKTADVHVAFGDLQKKPFMYELRSAPVTMTRSGKVIALTIQGKSTQGVLLKVTASCGAFDEVP